MTLEELKSAKELHNVKDTTKHVEHVPSIHEDSNSDNTILGDVDSPRDKLQYEAFLTDPRRI